MRLGIFKIFSRKAKEAKPEASTDRAEAEETGWRRTLSALRERDPQLYGFAIYLHLDPMKGISEKLRSFLRKDVDVLSLSPEGIIDEAERCAREGMYARAMNGYVCAIDLLFLQAAQKLPTGDEGLRNEYEAKVNHCLSRLKELEAGGGRGEEDEVPWLGLIKAYASISGRARDVLELVVQAYSERTAPREGAAAT